MKTSLTLAFACLLAVAAPPAWSYTEDTRTAEGEPASSFHYYLTRTLALAAGFSADEADGIAVACQATDRVTFGGVTLTGTERPSVELGQESIGLYYHFGRRPAQAADGSEHPGGRDTCRYFADRTPRKGCFGYTSHLQGVRIGSITQPTYVSQPGPGQPGPCQVTDDGETDPEAAELERWAISGDGLPRFGAPMIAPAGGGDAAPVAGRSLEALGIYLHTLADSYSHEACQISCALQGHSDSPPVCTAIYWHLFAEYGPLPEDREEGAVIDEVLAGATPESAGLLDSLGVPFTRQAARSVWQALGAFRAENAEAYPGATRWSDDEAAAFIDQWTAIERGDGRKEAAEAAFAELAGGS